MKKFLAYEQNYRENIEKYFRMLPGISRKPFNCPNLIVLSEDVHIGGLNPGEEGCLNPSSIDFKKGSLICLAGFMNMANGISSGCVLGQTDIILDKKKNFKACCLWGHKFKLMIKEFHPLK